MKEWYEWVGIRVLLTTKWALKWVTWLKFSRFALEHHVPTDFKTWPAMLSKIVLFATSSSSDFSFLHVTTFKQLAASSRVSISSDSWHIMAHNVFKILWELETRHFTSTQDANEATHRNASRSISSDERAAAVPVFEREARVKYFVTFECTV